METPQLSSTPRDLTQTISSKKSTLSHSILDMQSFSPPRVLLSHQHGAYRDSLNGDVFLSKFKHQFLMPSSDLERQEFPTDLVSEASATGNDSIQLQSPERATNTIPTRTNKAHSSSKQSLQIRVPSGRSPKRLNQSPKLNQSTQIFDVVGYHLQPSDKKAEVSKEKKEIKRMVTNGIASKSPKSRSTSAPRHNPKISHLSPYNSRMSTISSSSLPNKSTKVSSTSTKEVRQVSPFPKPKSSVVQGSVVSTTPRPRSAPPRSQVSHLRKETNASSGAGSNFMVSNTSRQSKQSSQHHDASRGSKGKSRQSSSSSSNVKKGNEDINLSLNSDYPVWK